MFIEYHMIQNFAPSNLNRDDTNNPKDCEFGGIRRARISSQCIKRAIRLEPVFTKITQVPTGERTRWLATEITKKLIEKGKPEPEAQERSIAFVGELLGGMDKGKDGRSKVLFYISAQEKDHIADVLLANWENLNDDEYKKLKKEYEKTFGNRSSAPDIALFGRMLADDPKLNMDAACQVAHAISTHRVSMDVDFFTAVDDLLDDEDSGAGMMGVTGFNSACFYRYACIDWEQLKGNLGGDSALAAKTVEGFLRSSIQAVPTGKQNSFAAQNAPSFMMAVVREDGACWSLANAFEKPVRADNHRSLTENSIDVLDKYWGNLTRVYGGDQKIAVLALEKDLTLENLGGLVIDNVDNWVGEVLNALPKE